MRVIALSDSHGCRDDLRDTALLALESGPVDACVFLGDGLRDYEAIKPMLRAANPRALLYGVRGNNDFSADEPYTQVFTVGGCRFFATHGQAYGVKYGMERLCFAAREERALVAFYGHTHVPMLESQYGVWFVNPGAVCDRRAGRPAYAQVTVNALGAPKAELIRWRS